MPLFQTLDFFSDNIPRNGAEQMALDEALLECATVPVLRIYRWDGPAVSFGYSQSLAAVKKSHPSVPLVRRWTGGGIVEHGRDLTFSLMVPCGEPLAKLRPAETYRLIHEAVAGLMAGGARLIREGESAPGDACFTAPAVHDVTADDGRKLCGGAQRRTRRGFLHQGSIQNIRLPEDFGRTVSSALAEETIVFHANSGLLSRTDKLAATKYGTPAWTERIP